MVYKSGKKIYIPIDPKPLYEGMRINSPHFLCQMVVNEPGIQKYTLVVAQYEKMKTIYYTLRVFSSCQFNLSPIKNPYNVKKTETGKWEGRTAGGCGNGASRETWKNNPVYQISLEESSDENQILIDLKGPKQYSVGFEVQQVSSPRNKPLQKKNTDVFRPGYTVLALDKVPAGSLYYSPMTFENGLVTLLNPLKLYESVYHAMGLELYQQRQGIHLEPPPSQIVGNSFGVYDLKRNNSDSSFTVSASYGTGFSPISSEEGGTLSLSSFIGGTDQQCGVLVSILKNEGAALRITYTHQLPWFMLIYYHTLAVTCTDLKYGNEQVPTIHQRHFVPSISRKRPALIEMDLDLPSRSKCQIQIEFEKAFLRIREYPPDANHGMYVPAAVVTFEKGTSDEALEEPEFTAKLSCFNFQVKYIDSCQLGTTEFIYDE
ncbi:calpain large subunit, domain III, partial [Ostertagia ostertagi]